MMQAFCSVSVCNAAVFLYVTAQRAAAERCTPFEGSASIIQCFHIKHHSLLLLHVACLYWRVTDTQPRFTHSSSKFKCCRGDSIYHWADIVKNYIAYLEFNMKNKHLNFSMPNASWSKAVDLFLRLCSRSSLSPRWFESQSPAGESEAQRDAGEATTQRGSNNVKCWGMILMQGKLNELKLGGPPSQIRSADKEHEYEILFSLHRADRPMIFGSPPAAVDLDLRGLLCQEGENGMSHTNRLRAASCDASYRTKSFPLHTRRPRLPADSWDTCLHIKTNTNRYHFFQME